MGPPATASVALVALWLATLVPLIGYAVVGWYARYAADDYCTAGAERALGFLGAQAYWYQNWSGRFSYFLVSGAIEFFGPHIVQVLPGLALAAWLAVGTWALLPLAGAHCWPRPRLSATLVSGAVILMCLQGAPDLDQALYWQTGMLTYLLPVVLLTAYAGWLVRHLLPGPRRAERPAPGLPADRLSRGELLSSGVFLFFAAGLSETSLSVQLAAIGMATVLAGARLLARHDPPSRRLVVLLAAGLLATLVSAGVVLSAPGSYVREASTTGSIHGVSDLPAAVQASIDFVGLFARAVQFRARTPVVLIVLLGLAFGWSSAGATAASAGGSRSTRPTRSPLTEPARTPMADPAGSPLADPTDRLPAAPRATRAGWGRDAAGLLGSVVAGWLLLLAATLPGYFAQAFDPPERAQFVGVWVAAAALLCAVYCAGRLVARLAGRARGPDRDQPIDRRRLAAAGWLVAALALAASTVASVRAPLARLPADAAYASAWDALDATLRTSAGAGQPVVLDHSLPAHFGFDFLGSDPGSYPNPCVAQFYAIPSVIAPDPSSAVD